jgi:hypothetical protein
MFGAILVGEMNIYAHNMIGKASENMSYLFLNTLNKFFIPLNIGIARNLDMHKWLAKCLANGGVPAL